MIINFLLNIIVLVVGAIFAWLPDVTVLPTIGGYDIDSAFVTGIGSFNTFTQTFWPLKIVFTGFLFLMGYYAIKIGVKFFLGHRAPGVH